MVEKVYTIRMPTKVFVRGTRYDARELYNAQGDYTNKERYPRPW